MQNHGSIGAETKVPLVQNPTVPRVTKPKASGFSNKNREDRNTHKGIYSNTNHSHDPQTQTQFSLSYPSILCFKQKLPERKSSGEIVVCYWVVFAPSGNDSKKKTVRNHSGSLVCQEAPCRDRGTSLVRDKHTASTRTKCSTAERDDDEWDIPKSRSSMS